MPRAAFAVAVRFQLHAANAADFLAVVKKQAANSLSLERDCHQFDVCVDPEDPCRIFLYETYTDAEAFEGHRKTPHFAVFNDTVGPWVADKEVTTWTISEADGSPSA
jgi:quinol monooxygenase YgiN